MTRRRNFNQAERNALYIASGGICALCGEPLDIDWEPDHIYPYSKDGETEILNGQALCRKCNRKKGAKVMTFKFRAFQERAINLALTHLKSKLKYLVTVIPPGGGKTYMALAIADRLIASGEINQVVVFVPRLILGAQFELDWNELSPQLPYPAAMKGVHYRPNEFPLLIPGASGYVATYASLTNNPKMHIDQIAKNKTLVIFDESHQLGVDEIGDKSTQSARWARECADKAQFCLVMSGTPMREDNLPLLGANYTEKDESGFRYLRPDIHVTYRQGVADGYLRRFEAVLHKGEAVWKDFFGGEKEVSTASSEIALGHIVQHEGFWQPLVDQFIQDLLETKRTVDSRMTGLIAGDGQDHVKAIEAYIHQRWPEIRCLSAVSKDGELAQKNLRAFKLGQHDVLLTVAMAFMGYDYKPICRICLLTAVRSFPWLHQLCARGMRVWSEVDIKNQMLRVYAPDDPDMVKFTDWLRSESEAGYQELEEKEERERQPPVDGGIQIPLGKVIDAWMTEVRAMGIDPTGDMTPDEFRRAEALRLEKHIPYPATDLVAFARLWATNIPQPPPTNTPHVKKPQTMTEVIKTERNMVSDLSRMCDVTLAEAEWGTTNLNLARVYRKKYSEETDINLLKARIKTIQRWMSQGYYDEHQ